MHDISSFLFTFNIQATGATLEPLELVCVVLDGACPPKKEAHAIEPFLFAHSRRLYICFTEERGSCFLVA